MDIKKAFGEKIKRLRKQRNLTQEQLADRLYVTRTMVSKWERDICQPDRNTIMKMADIFSVSPDEIISVEDAVINELFKLVSDTDSRDLLKDLNEFLSTLNSRDRSVFIRRYYYFEDISVIAENYGIKEGNVRTVLMRTRKKFKKYLEGMIR